MFRVPRDQFHITSDQFEKNDQNWSQNQLVKVVIIATRPDFLSFVLST